MKKTVVSGMQATGKAHLGNYLGAISYWQQMQEDYDCFFFLADLHALTAPPPPEQFKRSIIETAAQYIACGLDPKKSVIFPQSFVKEHTELAWILSCCSQIGWLNRMTQFKDKAGKNQEMANCGLFYYPVLMAADILLYRADLVPVGDDQKQHIEFTRDVAAAFNKKLKTCAIETAAGEQENDFFPLPEALIQGDFKRIMSLRDGRKKMSKSDISDFSRINLGDSRDEIYKKIQKAKTDHFPTITYDLDLRPEVSNLINIYSAISGRSKQQIIDQYSGLDSIMLKFKQDLSGLIIEHLSPISLRYNELMNNQDYVLQILKSGAEKAREYASSNINKIKEILGFCLN